MKKWCTDNALIEKTDYIPSHKPVFSIFRNHRDRIISGIAEDLFNVTLQKHSDLQSLPDNEKKQLCLLDIETWAKNPHCHVTHDAYHYGFLHEYVIPKKSTTLKTITWIKFEDLLLLDKIITQNLGIDNNLLPMNPTHFQIWNRRPSKEWYFYHISKFPNVVVWLDQYLQSQPNIQTI